MWEGYVGASSSALIWRTWCVKSGGESPAQTGDWQLISQPPTSASECQPAAYQIRSSTPFYRTTSTSPFCSGAAFGTPSKFATFLFGRLFICWLCWLSFAVPSSSFSFLRCFFTSLRSHGNSNDRPCHSSLSACASCKMGFRYLVSKKKNSAPGWFDVWLFVIYYLIYSILLSQLGNSNYLIISLLYGLFDHRHC